MVALENWVEVRHFVISETDSPEPSPPLVPMSNTPDDSEVSPSPTVLFDPYLLDSGPIEPEKDLLPSAPLTNGKKPEQYFPLKQLLAPFLQPSDTPPLVFCSERFAPRVRGALATPLLPPSSLAAAAAPRSTGRMPETAVRPGTGGSMACGTNPFALNVYHSAAESRETRMLALCG